MVDGVEGEGGEDEVALLFAAVALDEEAAGPQLPIEVDLLALPVFGVAVVELRFDCVVMGLQLSAVSSFSTRVISSCCRVLNSLICWFVKYHVKPETMLARMNELGPRPLSLYRSRLAVLLSALVPLIQLFESNKTISRNNLDPHLPIFFLFACFGCLLFVY